MRKQFTFREPKRKEQALYLVIIGHRKMADTKIGAVYVDKREALAEVKRLNEANRSTRAYLIRRVVELPSGEV